MIYKGIGGSNFPGRHEGGRQTDAELSESGRKDL